MESKKGKPGARALRVLVTGAEGFVGRHLCRHILETGRRVYGTIFPGCPPELVERVPGCEYRPGDITDASFIQSLLQWARPDWIIHLAAVSFPPEATRHPEEAWRINLCGTLNLFESVRVSRRRPRILFIGSADEYGAPAPDRIPITENSPLSPVNVYGGTKAAGDMAAAFFAERHGLDIVRVRPFNHTGPGQSPRFVCSDFARQVAEAMVSPGSKRTMSVGNLEARRDFSDVRDIVRAYVCALERGVKGEAYNIASGSAVRIGDMLAKLMQAAGVKIEIKQDPSRLRSADVPLVVGDSTKFRQATGWKPEIPFDQTLRDLLDYWRRQLTKR